MLNQLQNETIPQPAYTPLAAPQQELTTASPQELTTASPQELTTASPQELTTASPQELTTASPQELTKRTHPQASEVQNTQAVHLWLANIQRKTRRDKQRYWGLFIFFQAFLFLPICLSNSFPVMHNHSLNPTWLALLILSPAGMGLLASWAFLRKPSWNAEELRRVGGIEAFGTLLDLLSAPKAPKQLPPLYAALTELLPQMKAGDAARLTAGQRKMLHWSLKNAHGETTAPAVYQKYRLAVLKALEQIGDAAAIPIVEALAKRRARSASQKAIKAAALECLPLLRVNFGSAEATKTLLRASSQESSAPDVLLRATEFTAEANPEQLLRAAETKAPPPPSA